MKIGFVDAYALAKDLRSWGIESCQDAQDRGAFLTTDEETRKSIDLWLKMLRQKGGDL